MPTFVSAHTFCASRKPWVSSTHALGLTLTQSTTLSRTRLKWKQNFPIVTKSSLMNLFLNQERQNDSISLTTNCLRLPAENLAIICRKLYWNPTVNTYLQMAWCARKTSARYANVSLTGEVTGKNVTGTVKVFKKINNLKKRVVTPTFYVMKWSDKSIQHVISFWLWAKGI